MAGMPASRTTFLALAPFLVACSPTPVTDVSGRMPATVVSVVDGDTISVRVAGRRETVRLIGVNTPETKHPVKPVECFGPEASRHTAELLPVGAKLWVWRDIETRDKYDRLLLYVERAADGLFVNLDLVAGGWAEPYPFPPNTSLAEVFASAARDAEARELGLWGACPR